MRAVRGLAWMICLSAAAACGVHSALECTDRIPCPDGMECSVDGICVLVLPADAAADGRVPVDGPDAAPEPDGARPCGDLRCLGDETCSSCPGDCGECPFRC